MGGYGSGRQGGRPTTDRTESVKLSIYKVMRGFDGKTPIGRKWEYSTIDGELTALVFPRDDRPPDVELRYRFDHDSRDTGDQVQTVQVTSSPCRFGGQRWWWICPRTGRRAAMLFLPNGGIRFLSREGYGLGYQSTRESRIDRAHRKAGRLYRKLGDTYDGPSSECPDKPKGMHWRIYNAICKQISVVERYIDRG
jgi:hypothetical protein